jgi:hypothetical protein
MSEKMIEAQESVDDVIAVLADDAVDAVAWSETCDPLFPRLERFVVD